MMADDLIPIQPGVQSATVHLHVTRVPEIRKSIKVTGILYIYLI